MTVKETKAAPSSAPTSRMTMKKPVRPDFAARDEKIQKLRAKIQEYDMEAKRKASEIDVLVNEARASNKLETMKRDLANIVHIKVQLEKLQANTRKRLSELRNPKSTKGPMDKKFDIGMSPEEIKQRMEQLTEKVEEEQDPADRERIIARIQGLNSAWQDFKGGPEKAQAESNERPGRDLAESLEQELSKCAKQLEDIHMQERGKRGEIEDLRAKTSASQPAIDRLRSEREVCLTVVRSLLDTIKTVNEEYSTMFDKYKEDIKEFNAQRDIVMAERRMEREAEQKAREAERAKREMETKGPPFSAEIMRCDQLERWCKQFERSAVKKATPAAVATPDLDGLVALKKKDYKKKGGKANHKNGTADSSNNKIMLDIEILSLLSKLKLPIPATMGDLPNLAEGVREKRIEYEDKQKRALAGEEVAEEGATDENLLANSSTGRSDSSPVAVSMRCDEAFGQVILEIAAN